MVRFFIIALWGLIVLSGCERPPKDMVLVPKGEFIMGSNSSDANEGPERSLTLPAFYMDSHEVTNSAYREFIRETGHKEPRNWVVRGFEKEKASHPVVYVDLNDAKSYCEWKGRRLPTEEEWEKAARGVEGFTYPWGMEFDRKRVNTSLSGLVGSTSAGSYENGRSPYGLYDMAGNVWEWTSSDYGNGKKSARGGSWGLTHRFARTFTRVGYGFEVRINNLGFRCAKNK